MEQIIFFNLPSPHYARANSNVRDVIFLPSSATKKMEENQGKQKKIDVWMCKSKKDLVYEANYTSRASSPSTVKIFSDSDVEAAHIHLIHMFLSFSKQSFRHNGMKTYVVKQKHFISLKLL